MVQTDRAFMSLMAAQQFDRFKHVNTVEQTH